VFSLEERENTNEKKQMITDNKPLIIHLYASYQEEDDAMALLRTQQKAKSDNWMASHAPSKGHECHQHISV
jgi:hypothetical protein